MNIEKNSVTLSFYVDDDNNVRIRSDADFEDDFIETNQAKVLVLFSIGIQEMAKHQFSSLVDLGFNTLMDDASENDFSNLIEAVPAGNA